jgi:hypothetical protein
MQILWLCGRHRQHRRFRPLRGIPRTPSLPRLHHLGPRPGRNPQSTSSRQAKWLVTSHQGWPAKRKKRRIKSNEFLLFGDASTKQKHQCLQLTLSPFHNQTFPAEALKMNEPPLFREDLDTSTCVDDMFFSVPLIWNILGFSTVGSTWLKPLSAPPCQYGVEGEDMALFKTGYYHTGQRRACTQRRFVSSSIVASSIDASSMVERYNDEHYPMTSGLAKGPAP